MEYTNITISLNYFISYDIIGEGMTIKLPFEHLRDDLDKSRSRPKN